jgi:tRNA dimethylallyltransferase
LKKIIVIAGPTASGKTDLAIQLAQYFNTEILSADSRQCYQELGVAVAKPNEAQLQSVKHHFINSHSIYDEVSAGEYERFGLAVLDEIFTKNDTAILVGGTGLYIKAICEGIDEMPAIDETIKKEVEADYQKNGLSWLQNEVKNTDPDFYAVGETENPMRLMRALTFKLSTQKSILAYRNSTIKKRPFEIEKYVIDIEKAALYKNINDRVEHMLTQGLVTEAEALYPKKHLKNLQTVGYTELFSYFDGNCDLPFAIDKIKQHTRNYAKRQVTWFKNQGQYTLGSAKEIARVVMHLEG